MKITKQTDTTYHVSLPEKEFTVTVNPNYKSDLVGAGVSDEELIKASFAFLLDREPVGSILSEFDLSVIETYFPEYPKEITSYLK